MAMSHRDPVRAGDNQHVQPRWEPVAKIAKDGVRDILALRAGKVSVWYPQLFPTVCF